jgi:hypothetical protein
VTVAVSVLPFILEITVAAPELVVKLETLVLGVELVKVTCVPDGVPVDHPTKVPDVKEPPLRLPKIFVEERLDIELS